ncbi:MAG: GH32 C-terminal domain-containing protein [Planctomycetaceae bacterium]
MKPHFFIAVLFSLPLYASEPIIIADFEGSDYQPWVASGDAFGDRPAQGTLPGQMNVDGFMGKGLVNSFVGGDASTGALTSPQFKIERRFIKFLIGGGKNIEATCMNLLIDDKVVRSATGPNDKPGGTERLLPEAWDVGEFIGRSAVIQIVDQATGGWGHINVDHIVQTDQKPAGSIANARREIQVDKRYLHLPIKNDATKRKVTMLVDGRVQVVNDIELADSDPDWWAFVDVSQWKGKTITLVVDQLPEDSLALQSIEQADTVKDAEALYREPLRGQFHFSSQRGWNNDPNGLVYYNGEYHLFYQHNPYGWGWGNMHWGHAVSADLVHWQELGDTLAPDELGPMFSGSAVVDWNNTSGLGKDGIAPLVLLYTAAGNPTVQCLAWSLDGRHFTKYSGNPILPEITAGNRDPKVIWHQPTGKWVMVLYVTMPEKKHTVHFLTSDNLRDWTPASVIEGGIDADKFLYECPDFFPLAVDGDASNVQWVLSGADSNYAIGDFDGITFTPRSTRLTGHSGKGFYAAQTFSDIPAKDGRRIQVGWFQTATAGMPFNQSMSVPLELRLTATEQGPRLTMNPVEELQALRSRSHRLGAMEIDPVRDNPLAGLSAELIELDARFEPGATTQVEFGVRGAIIRYDAATQQLSVNGHQVPAPLRGKSQRVQVFCDRTGLEVFAGDGLTYVPMPFQPKAEDRSLSVRVEGAPARFRSLDVHELRSAWPRRGAVSGRP